jgi:hypothetical protein
MAICAELERISSSFSVLEIEEQLLAAQIPQPPGDQRGDGILQPA